MDKQEENTTAITISANETQRLNNSNGRVGLTKDELMEYANAPFWVRLRNILFASFWIIWLAAIVVAVGYVVAQPSCNKAPK